MDLNIKNKFQELLSKKITECGMGPIEAPTIEATADTVEIEGDGSGDIPNAFTEDSDEQILSFNAFKQKYALEESVITFNGKIYPKNNNILILAGGGGSGKGFALDNMIAFEGKHLDVDAIKEDIMKFKEGSDLDKSYFEKYGKHLKDCELSDETDVSNLHEFVEEHNIARKINNAFFKAQSKLKNKANVIFDVTLKNYPKFQDIMMLSMLGGYKLENIHVVWVLNNINTAKEQNNARARKVKEDILEGTHKGVAKFMKEVLSVNQEYFNNIGDIYILFTNTKEKDNKLVSTDHGKFMEYINYVKIKSANENMKPYEHIMNLEVKLYDTDDDKIVKKEKLRDKINRYIPASCDKF